MKKTLFALLITPLLLLGCSHLPGQDDESMPPVADPAMMEEEANDSAMVEAAVTAEESNEQVLDVEVEVAPEAN